MEKGYRTFNFLPTGLTNEEFSPNSYSGLPTNEDIYLDKDVKLADGDKVTEGGIMNNKDRLAQSHLPGTSQMQTEL